VKVLILGSSGIIGQHMRLCVPEGVEPTWHRREADLLHVGCDLEKHTIEAFLISQSPDVIVNLAGESRPDVVEKDPGWFGWINGWLPLRLAVWCEKQKVHYLHISTQAVLGGDNSPYSANDTPDVEPVNWYGRQKIASENDVWGIESGWTIVRPTFVLGVRPMPAHGRQNPIEAMLEGQTKQVSNRWFSVSFAPDVAAELWKIATGAPLMKVVHLGVPQQTNRYEIAKMAGVDAVECKHEDFPGIAPRPIDTTYAGDALYLNEPDPLDAGIRGCLWDYKNRRELAVEQRTQELSIFTGAPFRACWTQLLHGFGPLHQAVAEDFRKANPKTDEELLNWYRTTEAYIWELSAYHCDPGFNYMGMCAGIRACLLTELHLLTASRKVKVLCLGDGIGDLTLSLWRAGFEVAYHDLAASRTAAFAKTRFYMYGAKVSIVETFSFCAFIAETPYDAIVSLDFLEHVPNVEQWAGAINAALKPGGIFVAQNAFALGNQEGGSMPMHLKCNDRFEKDWDPLLFSLGFEQLGPQWYRKRV
jgi:dTDP-4-dehydrorhamnose reductase/2-polyprenyl-3-methyl-5-hydroxy-6-metoxy-1,4-benzoquinol methylase